MLNIPFHIRSAAVAERLFFPGQLFIFYADWALSLLIDKRDGFDFWWFFFHKWLRGLRGALLRTQIFLLRA
jgi:hypothetical protein